ncbi:protein IL-40 [Perognathus longimembris pacificus]|uniref:protein IL-40 n=1 Tax=Perognathus longimembris pacificus TaxID=214514 RepID=UPI002018B095|nr:protein IL-40 [Perognathus longimembris pacificus]
MLLSLLCLAVLAPGSFPKEEAEGTTPDISISYEVLQVYPQSRRVLITCHVPQVPRPITYSLLASRNTLVARRVINTPQPAYFNINVTLKSSPDLLTYACQAASASGIHGPSTGLQMYWELWAKPVSQLQANFSLRDGGSGPSMEVICQVSSGSPPITYRLVRKDGHVCMRQRPPHGQPANFSFQLSRAAGWYQCQAENRISALSSAPTLVPPGELPLGPACVLAGSLVSIAAIASGMLGWTRAQRRLTP